MNNWDKLVEEIAKTHGISKVMADDIVRSQFKLLIRTMEEGEYKGVRLHHLGVFMVKPVRKEKLLAKFAAAKKRKEENSNAGTN